MKSDPDNVINAPWNMAQIYYIELSRLMRFKDEAFLIGDLEGWNNGLKAVYRRIYFKLNNDEKNLFKTEFNKIKNYFAALGNNPQNDGLLNNKIREKLDDIDTLIMQTMDKYKMIFPNIEIKSLGEYENRLGITNIKV